jgi:hypothetical protein
MKLVRVLILAIIFLLFGKVSISQEIDTISTRIGTTPVEAMQWTDNYITKWMYNEERSPYPIIGNSLLYQDIDMIVVAPGELANSIERLRVNGHIGLNNLLDFKTPDAQINWNTGILSFTSTIYSTTKGEIPPGPESQKTIMTLNGDNRKVGIGTTTPQAVLEVHTNAPDNTQGFSVTDIGKNKMFFVPLLSGYGYNPLSTPGDMGIFWTDDSGLANNQAGLIIAPHSASAAGLRIDKDGNIGIGINTPLEKLHVNGTTLTNSIVTQNIQITNDFSEGAVLTSDAIGLGSWKQPELAQSLWTASEINDNIYRLDGNVGIGTSNPDGYKLAVNGHIVAELIKVMGNVPGSDYVFLEDYKLMSLYELETFVNSNHHLPEVKSAKEFKEEGYNLGDMDDVLLRKVEELTLYTIDQQKQIDAQSKIIKEFEKQLIELKQQINKIDISQ